MMQSNDLSSQIKDLIAKSLHLETSSIDDTTTIEELGLDSLIFAEVIIAIESHFGRPIDTSVFSEELNSHVTMGAIVEMFKASLCATPSF